MSHQPVILMFSLEHFILPSNQHSSLVILNNNHTHLGLLPASVVILPTILKHFEWLRRIFFLPNE